MARIVNSRCVLAVRNLAVATRYYKEVLGFSQEPRSTPTDGAYWNIDDVGGFYREIVDRGALGHLRAEEQAMGTARVRLEHA